MSLIIVEVTCCFQRFYTSFTKRDEELGAKITAHVVMILILIDKIKFHRRKLAQTNILI